MVGPDDCIEAISHKDFDLSNINPDLEAKFGIILRAFTEIFTLIDQSLKNKKNMKYKVHVQYFEIYKEKIYDLIKYTNKGISNVKPKKKTGEMEVAVTKCSITSMTDVMKVIEVGSKHKKQAPTDMNERSSRSHTVLLCQIESTDENGRVKRAKLNMIDLAGSEKHKNLGDSEKLHQESNSINLSLLHLSNCIMQLSEGKKHVSFRDSLLTRYLTDTLSGNSNTVIICTASCLKVNAIHTRLTLDFGVRAKKIKTQPVMQVQMSVKELTALIKRLKEENIDLKLQITQLKTQNTETEENLKKNLDIGIPNESLEISTIQDASENHDCELLLENSNVDSSQFTEQIENDLKIVENKENSNEELQNCNSKIRELEAKLDENIALINDLKEKLKESEEKLSQNSSNSQKLQNEFQARLTQLNNTISNGNSYVQKLKK